MELYLQNWEDKLLNELPQTKKLRVISPFIKEQVIRKIHAKFDLKSFELISRFNLRDFASKVSSLDGLRFSVEKGAVIYGIKGLHSKVYLFDRRSAIITSANLTSGGLINNYECGIYLDNALIVQELHGYFDNLKAIAGQKLTLQQCDDWASYLSQIKPFNTEVPSLPDYGSSPIKIDRDKNYYIKFFGSSGNRVPSTLTVREEVERSLCHYACAFPKNKKPRQIQDGDIVYMARMTRDPSNYAIYGKAEAIKFVEGRDKATKSEIAQRPWKENWPNYLRVRQAVFIDGTLQDCPWLYDLIDALDYESFPSTSQRYEEGERGINPKRSLSQQASIKLTNRAAEWLEARFQNSINQTGPIPKTFIQSLPQPQTKI